MTRVNLLGLFGTSITVDIGDIPPEEALYESTEFPWGEFDDALAEYFDSLSEEELRQLYRGPEAISVEDPVFDEHDDVDVFMRGDDTLPDYLQELVEQAQRYYTESNVTIAEAAYETASEQRHIVSDRGKRDNLEVLQDLRDAGFLCTDEMEMYSRGAMAYDPDAATIEAIVQRSLEEMLHEKLSTG